MRGLWREWWGGWGVCESLPSPPLLLLRKPLVFGCAGARRELVSSHAHVFSYGSPQMSPRVDAGVQVCFGAWFFFSPSLRRRPRGRHPCVQVPRLRAGFASCVPEDASQVRRDTCAYGPRPRVNTCACALPPGSEGASPREDGQEGRGGGHSPVLEGAAQQSLPFSPSRLSQSNSKSQPRWAVTDWLLG